MRIDIVTIFPEFFSVLDVSLLGKARASGLIDLAVHDLRDYTYDRHRTVDDTPYGGGAGMVMKPEPWGEVLDSILYASEAQNETPPVIIFPSPAGELFTQSLAAELAGEHQLVFGCGRYEGIDQRVVDYAATRARVRTHQPRRLRAQRRRGGRHGHDRGHRAADPRCGRQSRKPRRGVPRRTGCWSTRATPSRRSGADSTCPPVLLSGNHGLIARGATSSRSSAPAPSGPTCCPDLPAAEPEPPGPSSFRRVRDGLAPGASRRSALLPSVLNDEARSARAVRTTGPSR